VSSVGGTGSISAANLVAAQSQSGNDYHWASSSRDETPWAILDLGTSRNVAEVRITPWVRYTNDHLYSPGSVALSISDNPDGPFAEFAAADSFGTGLEPRVYAAPPATNGRYVKAAFTNPTIGAINPHSVDLSRIEVMTGELGAGQVAFTDASTGPAAITSWEWTLGDGTTSSVQNPDHAYQTPGTYNVTLTATDSRGAKATYTRPQVVKAPMTLNVTFPNVTPREGGTSLGYVQLGTNPGLGSALIDWGDGSTNSSVAASAIPTTGTATRYHVYAKSGTYTITVTGTDAYGQATNVLTKNVIVPNALPTITGLQTSYASAVGRIWNPPVGIADASPNTVPLACDWDYGDGTQASGTCDTMSAGQTWGNHVYTAEGVYTAKLTVTDEDGGKAERSTKVNVGPADTDPPDLVVTVYDNLDQVTAGSGSTTHYVEISNQGGAIALNLTVTLEVTGPVEAGRSDSGSGKVTTTADGFIVTWTIGVEKGTTVRLYHDWYPLVTAPAGAVITATARVEYDGSNGADPTPENNWDTDTTVVVAPTQQTALINYVDNDEAGKEIQPVEGTQTIYTGPEGTAIGFTEAKAREGVPAGYDYVNITGYTTTYDRDSTKDQAMTVHVKHHHTAGTLTTQRIVTYFGAGAETPSPVTQTMTWQTDTDEATGTTKYSSDEFYPEVTSPVITGYVLKHSELAVVQKDGPFASTTTRPYETWEVLVEYMNLTHQQVTVVYVDDDAAGQVVPAKDGAKTVLEGLPGAYVGFTKETAEADAPAGYLVDTLDNVTIFDNDNDATQTITVHLKHKHEVSSLIIKRTITYSGLGSAKPSGDVVHQVVWTVDHDQVTGVTTYSTDQTYPEVVSPVVAGYSVSPEVVPASSPVDHTTQAPVDSSIQVIYTSLTSPTQTVAIVYADDDADGTPTEPAEGAKTRLTGTAGEKVGFTEEDAKDGVPANYLFAGLDNVEFYDTDSDFLQTITVHLQHKHSTSNFTTTRTITYQGTKSSPNDERQEITWVADTDAVTGVTTYSTTEGYEAFTPPGIPGYTASPAAVPATDPIESISTKPTDSKVVIEYSALPHQYVTVVYVDDDAGQVVPAKAGAKTVLEGLPGADVGFTKEAAEADAPAGYLVATLDNVATFDDDSEATQTITVHLRHQHEFSSIIITRTITYDGAGDATPEALVQEAIWQSDHDAATGQTVYSSAAGYAAVTPVAIPGYSVSPERIDATDPAGPTATKPSDSSVAVIYTKLADQVVRVVYTDDDNGGKEIEPQPGTQTVLTGPAGSPTGFTEEAAKAGVPEGYDYAGVDDLATAFDDDPTVDQTITVHVTHRHQLSTITATRTIRLAGAAAASLAPIVQELVWQADLDLADRTTTYSAAQGYPEVIPPEIAGHYAVPAVVEGTGPINATDEFPPDPEVTVTYFESELAEQVVSIVYLDDEAGGVPVAAADGTPNTLTGAALGQVGFTMEQALAGVPANYVLTALENVESFDDDPEAAQTITVRLAHLHTLSTLITTRTIAYTGADDATPEQVVQDMVWQVDLDHVTGVTTYSVLRGYPPADSPAVSGYTPSTPVVPGTTLTGPITVPPTDSVVTVTYMTIVNGPPIPDPGTGTGPGVGTAPATGTGGSTSSTAQLPLTGSQGAWFVALAALLGLAGGSAMVWLGRRQRR
jgi:LPXTG-motif cell wall-anchored protein